MIIPEFQSFNKIANIGRAYMTITQKLHGTNACIYIYEQDGQLELICGSRTRWITSEDDNYGFARFVNENKDEFIEKLGLGRHFGEWAGAGINSGEGLPDKRLFLFNVRRWHEMPLPPKTSLVPVLYAGKISMDAINECMQKLKENGSYVIPGFMKPEGIVIEIDGNLYKKVFDAEETGWTKGEVKNKVYKARLDVSYLLQPIRLQKIISKDERYIRNYPESLKEICSAYVQDLEDEDQIIGTKDEIKVIKKALGGSVFQFVKAIVSAQS
jgi:hypothetical protein